jgi:hypothetical protein
MYQPAAIGVSFLAIFLSLVYNLGHLEDSSGKLHFCLLFLQENRDDANFDTGCRKLVVRRIIQQMKDYRLNPRLQKSCRQDLPKFCSHLLLPEDKDAYKEHSERDFLEGRVISCLKDSFAQGKPLTKPCQRKWQRFMK